MTTRSSLTKICRACGGPCSRSSRNTLCRPCSRKDPEIQARRTAGIQRRYDTDPAFKAAQRAKMTERNRSPERRALSGQIARDHRLWESGVPKTLSPEVRQKQTKTRVDRQLAHIPAEHREMYRALTRKFPAAEAARLVQEHHEKQIERFKEGLKRK